MIAAASAMVLCAGLPTAARADTSALCGNGLQNNCRSAGTSRLLIKNSPNDAKDKLAWKWLKGAATTLADFGVPTGTTAYALCIYAGTSTAAIAAADIAPSNTLWAAKGSTGFRYKDPAASSDGIRKVILKAGATGKAKAVVRGKGATLPDLAGPLTLPVTAQLVNSANNVCFQGIYDGTAVKKNDAERFKARTAGLSGTLFVTDDMANKVYMLDAATGDILASADTGEHPIGVEKANGKVYVANETSGTISVYGSATLSPLTVIPACERPHHAAASPDGSRFYAACLGTNKVAVVDTGTDALVGLLTSGEPGARTHAPWPTKDGERLWVANHGTDDITEIDLQTGAILRVFPIGAQPNEVVVPADAKTAYVSVPALSKMMVFDLETNQLVAEPARFAPAFLMLSSDGKTILASWAGFLNPTAVSIFDTATLTSVDVALPGILATHTDLTPHAKFGFVSLVGLEQSGIAVVDIEAATLHAFYPIPEPGLGIHAVRYAPGPP